MSKKDSSKNQLHDLQQKCEEYLHGWQRSQADYANLEKEATKRQRELIKLANAGLLMELLPVYDNLKLAINHIPKDQKKLDWVIGIDHIKNQFSKFLEDNGVEQIKTIGQKFDTDIHEAVKKEEGEDSQDNIIKKEVKSGYKLNGKVLYPAKVVV